MNFICPSCDEDFETDECPYGDGVQCPHCHVWMDTDWDEDYDNVYCWVKGVSEEQNR